MELIQFRNPSTKTYLNEECGSPSSSSNSNEKPTCNIGFLFCLVDLPFRNPQNCSLGDFATPVLTTNSFMNFGESSAENYSYKFKLKELPLVSGINKRKNYQQCRFNFK